MAQPTTRLGLPRPEGPDQINTPTVGPHDIRTAFAVLDDAAMYGQSVHSSRPAPALAGRLWRSTDTGEIAVDTGVAWLRLAVSPVHTPDIADDAVTTGKIADGAVAAGKIAAALKPSGSAAAGTEALRALGGSSGQALPGNTAISWSAASPASGWAGNFHYARDHSGLKFISGRITKSGTSTGPHTMSTLPGSVAPAESRYFPSVINTPSFSPGHAALFLNTDGVLVYPYDISVSNGTTFDFHVAYR